jgi:hypothetical protein
MKKKKSVKRKTSKKKVNKKKPVKRRKTPTKKQSVPRNDSLEKALIQNTIALQKVTTNLAIKFDNLSQKMTKLLELFEMSAKTLAEKEFNIERGDQNNEKLVDKMDSLLDQNKTIARGLSLLHETKPTQNTPIPQQIPKPEQPMKKSSYQESISNRPRTENMAGI